MTVDHEYQSKAISLHVFNCTPLAGEPKALDCEQIRWVDPIDLKRFSFPPPDIKVIEYLTGSGYRIEG